MHGKKKGKADKELNAGKKGLNEAVAVVINSYEIAVTLCKY